MTSADIRTVLDALDRARMRDDEGDAPEHVIAELLANTDAPAKRLRTIHGIDPNRWADRGTL